MLYDKPKVPWRRLLWSTKASLKCQVFLWLVVQQRLHTSDRLSKWGVIVVKFCQLCQEAEESHDHVFLGCRWVNDIRLKVMVNFLLTKLRILYTRRYNSCVG